jgi:hypothetical protein
MKNQYFGDRNDYFKYDLLIFLAEQIAGIQKLSVIWMLTGDDGSRDGQKVRYGKGARDRALYGFLQQALDAGDGTRNVNKLEEYFREAGHRFSYCAYGAERLFLHRDRAAYFDGIPKENLDDAVVFLDPDIGLEVKATGKGNGDKYVTYSDLISAYDRMGEASILVIYQHLPFVHRKLFLYRTADKLMQRLKCPMPVSISDNTIAFIILTKTRKRQTEVRTALHEYVRSHLEIYD